MDYVALGKTNILASKTAFSALSLECREIQVFGEYADEKAVNLVKQAYENGINFFDVSHAKPIAEKRLGAAILEVRQNVCLSARSLCTTGLELRSDLAEILDALGTDYIDVLQIQDPAVLPKPDGADGLYNALQDLKSRNIIRAFGVVTESIDLAREVIESQLFDVVQFPFSVISGPAVEKVVKLAEEKGVGCLGMEPLNGGMVLNIPLAYGYLNQFENLVPVWGVRTQEELQQLMYFVQHPPVIDEKFQEEVLHEQRFYE